MSTLSSANVTDVNLVLKERTHKIKIKDSMHQYSILMHILGKWPITFYHLPSATADFLSDYSIMTVLSSTLLTQDVYVHTVINTELRTIFLSGGKKIKKSSHRRHYRN